MNHFLMTNDLVETIQAERRREAGRRRALAKALVSTSPHREDMMRMALGPGTQFAGVTERILDTVTGRTETGHGSVISI